MKQESGMCNAGAGVVTTVVLSAAMVAACSPKSPESRLVADAAAALGGRDRILAVHTLTLEGEGSNANLGQDMTMEASGQAFAVTGYRRVIDVAGLRSRTEQIRTPNFAYFQGMQPQKQIVGVAGGAAYTVAANGTATRSSDAVAKDRSAELFHHPLVIVRAALAPGAALANARTAGNERVVDLIANGGRFTLAIDAATSLPTRVVSMTDQPNLGDVAIETAFAAYQDVSGVKLPTQITTRTDKYQTAALRVTVQRIDEPAGELDVPASAAAPAAAAPTVTAEEVAKGIWFLAGQSHHSALVEFADHLTLIEAPQSEARTMAVIAKARELRPGKPLTEVVNTHHHFDHSAGIRAAIDEGLTVVTHRANVAYLQDAAQRAHTIAPDRLARNPKPARVTAVDGELTEQDAANAMVLYPIDGNPHGSAMLMAYFPRQRVLVQADAFSPGSATHPYAANLLENIRRHQLKVDRIVPLHGTLATMKDLEQAAARP
jgi:glyoxylase-like metal-dependent hydrolase (beta-lactamase superfamily II)